MGSILDVFNGEAFKLRSMCEAINKIPPMFNYLGSEGIFTEQGSSSTTVAIEENQGKLALIPNSQRGTRGYSIQPDRRKVRAFVCAHKQVNEEILADQVLGVRRFGSEVEMETPAQKVAEKLETAQNSMEITLEWMRLGAVKGQVLDADGTTVVTDLFQEFGVTPRHEKWEIDPKDKSGAYIDGAIKRKCNELIRKTSKILGGTPFTGFDILCGNDFFDAIENSKEFRNVYHNTPGFNWLTEKHTFRYFEYGGIRFVNYQAWIGDKDFIAPGEGYALPRGVDGLFTLIFGPADYIEAVNAVGIKYYAKQERMKFDKGIEIECQTNPLALCTRPDVLCKFTLA